MKTLLLLLLLTGCAVADRIEESHNVLWDKTKALRVISAGGGVATLESFSNPSRTYMLRCNMQVGDTIIMTDDLKLRCKYLKAGKRRNTACAPIASHPLLICISHI